MAGIFIGYDSISKVYRIYTDRNKVTRVVKIIESSISITENPNIDLSETNINNVQKHSTISRAREFY